MSIEPGAAEPLEIEFAGETVLLDPSGALYYPQADLLVVADLHFEKGSFFAERGQVLPPYDTAETIGRLEAVIARHAPDHILSLGDAFHDEAALARMSAADRARLAMLEASADWLWLAGNHDPGDAEAEALRFTAGPLTFIHEPAPEAEPGEIAGHFHPCAAVTLRGRRLRRRCFASDGQRMILPAFGAYTGGLDVLSPPIRSLLAERFTAYLLGARQVHPVASARLEGHTGGGAKSRRAPRAPS